MADDPEIVDTDDLIGTEATETPPPEPPAEEAPPEAPAEEAPAETVETPPAEPAEPTRTLDVADLQDDEIDLEVKTAIEKVQGDEILTDGQKAAETARLKMAAEDRRQRRQMVHKQSVDEQWNAEAASRGLPQATLKAVWNEEIAALRKKYPDQPISPQALQERYEIRVAQFNRQPAKQHTVPAGTRVTPASGTRPPPPPVDKRTTQQKVRDGVYNTDADLERLGIG